MIKEGMSFLNKTRATIRRVAKSLRFDWGKIRRLETVRRCGNEDLLKRTMLRGSFP
jgi:hypothetical protein